MRDFKYLVIRRDRHGNVLYYVGTGAWSALRSDAKVFSGDKASVLCENLNIRGVLATFVVA